jgi:hypothetical protein
MVVVLCVTLALWLTVGNGHKPRTPSSSLAIHVEGDQLVNGKGNQIRLLGVDVAGTESGCVQVGQVTQGAPISQADADAIAAWKINAVRLPLNEDCWLGINGVSIAGRSAANSGKIYRTEIKDWVNDLNRAGIYVVLDLHWSAPGHTRAIRQFPMADENHSPTFWTSVASTFKSDPAVIFDLFNEPSFGPKSLDANTNGSMEPWTCWRNGCTITWNARGELSPVTYATAGMQQLVDRVRDAGATQPIMLGGLDAAGDPCGLLNKFGSRASCAELANMPKDPLHQLIVSYHNYWSKLCENSFCWNALWSEELAPLRAADIPLVTGEFGEGNCSNTFMNTYMTWADRNNVSYLAWSWGTDRSVSKCVERPDNNFYVNWALLRNYSGAPSTVIPQGAAYKEHLALVSPY